MQSFWYENDFFYSHSNITHFHKKGFSLSLIWQWEFLELGNGLLIFLLSVVNHPLTVTCWIRFQRHHDNITLWLVKWLAFRLMFSSGIVKLSSRCPTWWGLTALDWHYESQVQLACIQLWKGLIAGIYLGKKFTLFLLIVGRYMHSTTSKKVTVTSSSSWSSRLKPWDPILASRNSNILRIETGESSFEEWVKTINLCLSSTVSQLFLLLISQRLTNAWVSFICCSVSPPHWLGMHISSQNGFRG